MRHLAVTFASLLAASGASAQLLWEGPHTGLTLADAVLTMPLSQLDGTMVEGIVIAGRPFSARLLIEDEERVVAVLMPSNTTPTVNAVVADLAQRLGPEIERIDTPVGSLTDSKVTWLVNGVRVELLTLASTPASPMKFGRLVAHAPDAK